MNAQQYPRPQEPQDSSYRDEKPPAQAVSFLVDRHNPKQKFHSGHPSMEAEFHRREMTQQVMQQQQASGNYRAFQEPAMTYSQRQQAQPGQYGAIPSQAMTSSVAQQGPYGYHAPNVQSQTQQRKDLKSQSIVKPTFDGGASQITPHQPSAEQYTGTHAAGNRVVKQQPEYIPMGAPQAVSGTYASRPRQSLQAQNPKSGPSLGLDALHRSVHWPSDNLAMSHHMRTPPHLVGPVPNSNLLEDEEHDKFEKRAVDQTWEFTPTKSSFLADQFFPDIKPAK